MRWLRVCAANRTSLRDACVACVVCDKHFLHNVRDKSTAVQAGEEDKKKTYRCVVWLAKAISPADLLPLQSMKDLVIDQTTPIRVLHRFVVHHHLVVCVCVCVC